MRNVRCIQVALLVAVLLLASFGHVPASMPPVIDKVQGQPPTPEADAGNVIRAKAVLEPTGYEDIRSQAGQPLTVLFVAPEGKRVRKGDLLVELDDSALQENLLGQRIRYLSAEAELRMAQTSLPGEKQAAIDALALAEKALQLPQKELETYIEGEYPAQVAALQNALELAELRLAMATERLKHLEAAADSDPTLLAQAQVGVTETHAQLAAAKDQLRLLQYARKQRRIDELNLVIAQREFDLLRAGSEVKRITVQGDAALHLAEAVLTTEKERLARLEHQFGFTKLYSPRDGTVFYPRDASPGGRSLQPGDVVHDRQVIARVADLTQVKLDVPLPLPQIHRIAPRQSATIRFDAMPGRTFQGHVTEITTITDAPGAPAEGLIGVRVDDPGEDLKPGMAATVEFDVSNN